jgi:large subunit GTPase 1
VAIPVFANRESFLTLIPTFTGNASPLTVGFVGYPNVGKSSTINSLIGAKKVSVSSTPGKTKHFQTIHLSHDLVICDCPGLVFPQFALTKAELVCDGVLPIDQLREYTGPTSLVVQRIPKRILELTYGLAIPGNQSAATTEGLLTSYASECSTSFKPIISNTSKVARGFARSGQGNPDESRAARYILKDYVNAKLLFSHPPPGILADAFNSQSRDFILDSLIQAKKKRAPSTRVPITADTYVVTQLSQEGPDKRNVSRSTLVVDDQFFRPSDDLSSRPFIQGSSLHGQQFSRSRTFPHQNISGDDGTLLEEQESHSQTRESRLQEGHGKKHFKRMKKVKQRSGKGYE